MTQPTHSPIYCSECSRTAGEQLFGTAPRADVWMMLEYEETWGAKSPDDSRLTPTIKQVIQNWLQYVPNAKFTFIRQRDERSSDRESIRLYVARALEITPELYHVDLNSYDELLDLDLAALALGAPEAVEYLTDERLYIVCVNGRRDPSCAKYGTPLYEALRREAGSEVWQTTHIGGHRFAATCALLPEGVVYGFVDPDDVPDLVTNRREGKVRTDKMRGRSCYSEVAQAADYFLREARRIQELPGIRFANAQQTGSSLWDVQFEMFSNGILMTVTVEQVMSEFDVFKDSGGEGAPVPQFRLVDIR